MNDTHVLSEHSSLVGTNIGGICHHLTWTRNMNKELSVITCFMAKPTLGHCKWETSQSNDNNWW